MFYRMLILLVFIVFVSACNLIDTQADLPPKASAADSDTSESKNGDEHKEESGETESESNTKQGETEEEPEAEKEPDTTPEDLQNRDRKDSDFDGLFDDEDNCPKVSNKSQKDTDGDGEGDACDKYNELDWDNDRVLNESDNCPNDYNPTQDDADLDGIGDPCDVDKDGFSGTFVQETIITEVVNNRSGPTECFDLEIYPGFQSFEEVELVFGDGTILFNSNMLDNAESNYHQTTGDFVFTHHFVGSSGGLEFSGNVKRSGNFDKDALEIQGTDEFTFVATDKTTNNVTANCSAIATIKLTKVIDPDDVDNDTVLNATDNCVYKSNTDQHDDDQDGIGDLCDSDRFNLSGLYNRVSQNTALEAKSGQCEDIADIAVGLQQYEVSLLGFYYKTVVLTSNKFGIQVADYDPSTGIISLKNNFDITENGLRLFGLLSMNGTFDSGLKSFSNQTVVDLVARTNDDSTYARCKSTSTINLKKITNENNDWDGDGIVNQYDNCFLLAGNDMTDTDGDGKGDICDSDKLNITNTYLVDSTLTQVENISVGDECSTLDFPLSKKTHMKMSLIDNNFRGSIGNRSFSDWSVDFNTLAVGGGYQNQTIQNATYSIDEQTLSGDIVEEVYVNGGSTLCSLTSSFTAVKGIPWDYDNDGVLNSSDNCIYVKNADQLDENENDIGDVCE